MSYKVTRANEAVKYEAPGHFDVLTTRLHNPVDVNGATSCPAAAPTSRPPTSR